ncbi:MBL fold metallo-hydrolase [Deinococcus sp. YIM 77859]|uniref:MBL fold metallo-hydrolase n=1 Tax=Deinococcus sp. YIM 77859 TaxID=1540221 RepID=UPI00068EDF3A|nr:MBL fold metallo-hydrolase [Deinococcus sp. YIM 77859]
MTLNIGVRTLYANVYLLQTPQGRLMVDAGAVTHVGQYLRLLRAFQPNALFLTHHHVDHTGGAFLAGRLGIPILAHPLEHAFLTGQKHHLPYPAGYPQVGQLISRLHPKVQSRALHPVFPGERVYGWEVIPLPGHTLGQTGLLRDGVLVVGDALIGGRDGAHLPKTAYNEDQQAAVQTLHAIANMDLKAVLPGHGKPLTPEKVWRRARREEAGRNVLTCSSRDEQLQPLPR